MIENVSSNFEQDIFFLALAGLEVTFRQVFFWYLHQFIVPAVLYDPGFLLPLGAKEALVQANHTIGSVKDMPG